MSRTEIIRGCVPCKKNVWLCVNAKWCGGMSPHIPHTIFRFLPPQRKTCIFPLKFSCLPMHPNISLYIPTHLFCMKMCRNSQFTQIYMGFLLSPCRNSTCSRPHSNCSHWYNVALVPIHPHTKFCPSVGLCKCVTVVYGKLNAYQISRCYNSSH